MNLSSYVTAVGFTALAAKLLLINHYGKWNRSVKLGLGLLMYSSCENVVIMSSYLPVYFDSHLLYSEKKIADEIERSTTLQK